MKDDTNYTDGYEDGYTEGIIDGHRQADRGEPISEVFTDAPFEDELGRAPTRLARVENAQLRALITDAREAWAAGGPDAFRAIDEMYKRFDAMSEDR